MAIQDPSLEKGKVYVPSPREGQNSVKIIAAKTLNVKLAVKIEIAEQWQTR